jgi:hypothetical protein
MARKKRIAHIFLIALVAAFCAIPVFSQDCTELKTLIDEAYGFKPSKLTSAERTVRSGKMDAVWEKVKTDPKNLLPCLKAAIASRTSDTFFRFDAVNLNFSLDQSAEAKNLIVKNYADVDLDDIDPAFWMKYLVYLGYEGFDTTAAAENWMKHPNPRYYLPQHGTLAVNKDVGSVILYGSMDETIATPALARIASTEGHAGRELALIRLLQQATPESFVELRRFNRKGLPAAAVQAVDIALTKPQLLVKREGPPKTTRQQFLTALTQLADGKPSEFIALASSVPDGERDVVTVMTAEDIPLIRKARRTMMLMANPHSGEWYDSFSKILLTMVWKPQPVEAVQTKTAGVSK